MRFDKIWRDARIATLSPQREGLGEIAGAVAAKDGRIAFVGAERELPTLWEAGETVRLDGRWITPGLIDCHTHLVYAGDRAHEFELRLAGASYEEIARAGGGIVSTVKATRAASEDELVAQACRGSMPDRRRRHHDRDQVGLRARPATPRRKHAARRARDSAASATSTWSRRFSARMPCRPRRRDKDAFIDEVCAMISPRSRRQARGCGRRLLRGHRVLARADRARFRGRESARPAGQAACRPALQPARCASSRPSTARFRPIISNTPTRTASPRWRTPEPSRCCCRARSTCCARSSFRRSRRSRRHNVPIAIATDSNPGTSPITSLLLTMNMAATLFRLTVDECIAGVTREAARALGRLDEIGTLETGKCCDLAIWNIERPAELVYRIGFNPLHARGAEGQMTARSRLPASVSARRPGAQSRAAQAFSVDPAATPAVAASAAAVAAIVAQGRSRSTASIPASESSPTCASRRTTSASCSATSCCRMRPASASRCAPAIVRLMMALKLASLARGASGVRPRDARRCMQRMLDAAMSFRWCRAQGSVGASGDLAPLAHMAAAMIGVGEAFFGGERMPADAALGARRTGAARARPEGRSRAAQRHAILRPRTRSSALFAIERVFQAALITGALATDAAQRLRHAVRSAHPRAARPSRPDRGRGRVARADGGQPHPRLASHQRRPRAGPVLPALPAAGDGCGARPDAPGRRDARDRGERRLRQSAGVRRHRRSRCPAAISTPSRSRSRPTCWRSRSARSARSPSGASPCWSTRAVRPAGVPHAASQGSIPAS